MEDIERFSTAASAYGGEGWQQRTNSMTQEIGNIWHQCGNNNEWSSLKAVLLHEPGEELKASLKPDEVQMLEPVNIEIAQKQHQSLVKVYEEANVSVHYVSPSDVVYPNQMFVADLIFTTPEGAIIGRPASVIRAGEERCISRRLADIGIPIVCSIRGTATFEGADAAWLNPHTVLIGRGLRTNAEGVAQIATILQSLNVRVVKVDMPVGSMHLMGILRFADKDLAIAWPWQLAVAGFDILQECGYKVVFLPDELEAKRGMALNFVTLGPRKIIMPAGNPITQAFYEDLGITCVTVQINELIKAAGAIGCLTGIVERQLVF